ARGLSGAPQARAGDATRPRRVRGLGRGDERAYARRRARADRPLRLRRRPRPRLAGGRGGARGAGALARAARRPYLTTIHATEYGRHQGWVDKHPQSYIHGVERWMVRRAEGVVVCSHYMQGHVADVFDVDEAKMQ